MKITLKLFAALTDYLPERGRAGNEMACEVADGATVADLIEGHCLPARLVHLVLVNGVYIAPADRPTQVLREGDVLAVWPPVAGG